MHQLIDDNPDFDLESQKSSHVYIYKVFDLPFSILVQSVDVDGKPILVTDDPHILNRYFNPGQLALTVCSLIGLAGQSGILAYSGAIRDLPFYDFYVMIASGSNPDGLQQFGQALMKSIALDDHAPRLDLLRQDFAKKDSQVSKQMRDGAMACGIGEEALNRIFKPFDFKFEVRHLETIGKQPNQLVIGGNLNAIQANKLAEFFNEVVSTDSGLRDQANNLGVKPGSFAARARVE